MISNLKIIGWKIDKYLNELMHFFSFRYLKEQGLVCDGNFVSHTHQKNIRSLEEVP